MRFDKELYNVYTQWLDLISVNNGKELNPEYKNLDAVFNEINNAIFQFKSPLRVAVAGYMKAGKSTLLNAIMKKKAVCTGEMITTYTPTWFRYGEKESIELVFKDERHIADIPISDLVKWTSIEKKEENPEIDDVKYIIIYSDNELLKKIELIDTPGLFSPLEEDSERSIKLLGLGNINDANRIGENQVSMADAIIYAFSARFQETDLNTIKEFTSTPINAIGVFTKLDESYWEMDPVNSPIEKMINANVIKENEEKLKSNIYCIIPLIAKPAEGVFLLEASDWDTLKKISEVANEVLLSNLVGIKKFIKKNIGDTTEVQRERLGKFLGTYGVYLVVNEIKKGGSENEIISRVRKACNIDSFLERILSHFAQRSFLIKSDVICSRLQKHLDKLIYLKNISVSEKKICEILQSKLYLVRELRGFKELDLLRRFYEGEIRFKKSEDNIDFLNLMGEKGNNVCAKLGLSSNATIDELLGRSRLLHNHWSELSNSIFLSRREKENAAEVCTSLTELRYYLEMLSDF